ncbi:hypothetical protein V2J09_017963 [Rumex salicifolius]
MTVDDEFCSGSMRNRTEISGHNGTENLGPTIEIKIKTMDSQTHILRVDKQVPVPTLKEQIASVTGVVKEHQRLICRGRVLKDDQLLSAYHVEDGHTLHLVVREPPSSSMEDLRSDSAFFMPSGGRSEQYQIAPGVVVESFNMQGQGERSLPDVGRIVSAVLGSIGIAGPGNVGAGIGLREHGLESLGRIPVRGDATDTNQPHPEQPSTRDQSDRLRPRNAFGVGTAFSFGAGQGPVIPDAISTLSQYLSNMQREFSGNGEFDAWPASAMDTEQTEARSFSSENSQGLPTPASLAELLLSTRQLLGQQPGECLIQVARQALSEASVTDPDARLSIQSSVCRTGVLLQNMGAYLLELGRTIMTLRFGGSPSDFVLNTGPAVFISPSGPNPLMVQPLPFQPGASFGGTPAGTSPAGPSLSHGFGSGLLPRRIDIHIRRARQPETEGAQQPSGQQDSSAGANSDTITNEPTSANSNNSSLPGLYFPLFGRFQNMSSQSTNNRTGTQPPSEHQPSGLRSEQNVIPASEQQNTENPPRRQGNQPPSRTIDISIFSSGGAQSELNPDSQAAPPDSVLQFLRGLFPGGEVHVESTQGGAAPVSVPESENTTRVPEAAPEPRPTEDGIFLSRLLQQIMPFISQPSDAALSGDTVPSSSTHVEDSEAGTSRQRTDSKLDEPDVKRRKME